MNSNNISENCIFCKSPDTKYWFTPHSKSDDKTYPIYKCYNCNGAFVYPIPSEDDLNLFYRSSRNAMERNLNPADNAERYNQILQEEIDYPNATIDAQRIADNLKRLSAGANVLDVGSGYGFFSNALIKVGFNVQSVELSEASRNIYALMNGFEPQNCSFNSEFAKNNAGRFDVILLSQVLEHLPMNTNPVKNINRLLKINGICAIAVPHFRSFVSIVQGKKDMFIVPPEHVNFFTIKSLETLFSEEGFEAIKSETVSRYDYSRIKKRLGALSILVTVALRAFFIISDVNHKGMYINAYFRKNKLKQLTC